MTGQGNGKVRGALGIWSGPRAMIRSIVLWPRVWLGVATGLAALFLLPAWLRPAVRSSLAWDFGGMVYLTLAVAQMARYNGEALRRRAARTDDIGIVILAVILIAIAASFAAMSGLAGEGKDAPRVERLMMLGLAGATLVIAWLVTQVAFAIHYAHRHYAPMPDGSLWRPRLNFPGEKAPDYWDFLYFSTSIGAASQTSDVVIEAPEVRRLVTLHAIVSFFFNTMVLAVTINIAAGLL